MASVSTQIESLCRSSSTMEVPLWIWWGRTASPSPVTGGSVCNYRQSPLIFRESQRFTIVSSSVSLVSPPMSKQCTSAWCFVISSSALGRERYEA